MAITTMAGIRGAVHQNLPLNKLSHGSVNGPAKSWWGLGALPAAGAYDTTLDGVTLSAAAAGDIAYTNPASGNSYIAGIRGSMTAGTTTVLMIADRLWHNGGYTITSTSAQNSTTPTWPARDANGSTNGEGVLLALECSSSTGSATPTVTVSYTNSAGTSGRTGVNIGTTVNANNLRSVYLIGLQEGDIGVRSVESLTLSASWVSGTINLVAFRPIAFIASGPSGGGPFGEDALTLGFPRVFDSSTLYVMSMTSTAQGTAIAGNIVMVQG